MIELSKAKGQTFVFGAVILIISNILTKLIGAVLRIPLTNIVGVEGMAYYNAAYSIYVSFYMISTAGIPVAVSRMIASANSKNKHREIKKIFNVALILFFVIGFVGTAAMMIFAKQFANSANMPGSYYAMLAIAPTIFFICISSAYRGYFQGLQNMVPTAVSQVIEALGKLCIGIFAAVYFTANGYPMHIVAAFVILGVTIGLLLSTVYAMIIKAMYNASAEYKNNLVDTDVSCRTNKAILRELVLIAIPVTLASSIMGLTNVVDTMFLANGLEVSGVTKTAATSYYGTYTSMVFPLFNLVPPFIYPFAISAIPAISAAMSVGNREKVHRDIESAFRNCAIIAIPCAIGLGVLSDRIISFLFEQETIYNGNTYISTLDIAAPALSTVAVGIVFLGVISITNSVLQACQKEKYTIISTVSGIVVKIIATWSLSRIPDFGVLGAAIGTLLCYFTIMAVNVVCMIKTVGFVPNVVKIFAKPVVSGVACGVVALACTNGLDTLGMSHRLVTLISIAAAGVTYLIVLLALKGLNEYDVRMMPKGDKLCRILDKLHVLEKGE